MQHAYVPLGHVTEQLPLEFAWEQLIANTPPEVQLAPLAL